MERKVKMIEEYEVLKFEEYKAAGGKGNYDRGVLSITLSEWSEFYNEVRRFRNHKDYVWRGQRRGYPEWYLKSKFDRHPAYSNEEERKKILREHLEQFRKSIRGRRGTNPPELNDDELWALGQHHGLVTPLLDWTESPFVAAYFAFFKKIDSTKQNRGKRVVYGMNRDIVRWHQETTYITPDNKVFKREQFIKFPIMTAHENARLLAQSGVLTESLEGKDVKEIVQECYNKKRHRERIILVEIFIGDGEREECLRDVNKMNITHASLFPDIDGSATFCNLRLEIDKYR